MGKNRCRFEKGCEIMRYYSTQRPVGPGTCPVPDRDDPKWEGVTLVRIHNYDRRTVIPEIGRSAWGYIEYSGRIPVQEALDYELVPWSGPVE